MSCVNCQTVLGWKYDEAYEESQKYKEGKYILEKTRVCCVDSDSDVSGEQSTNSFRADTLDDYSE